MATVLVTGAAGFLGPHVTAALAARGHAVLGADLRLPAAGTGEAVVVEGEDALPALIAQRRPEVIVHGAFVNRRPAGCSERAYLDQMLGANLALLAAAARAGARLLLVSSSAVYGQGGGAELIDESCPPRPVSLYGLAKAMQEQLADYQASAGLQLATLRLFNLVGPGQALGMLIPDWVSRVVAIARGGEPVLRVPTQRTRRDFVDVRDAARAIALLVDDFRPGSVVNAASGYALSLEEIGRELGVLCPVAFTVLETDAQPSAANVSAQRGSFERLRAGWGWTPGVDWRTSLRDVWNEWLPRGQAGSAPR